MCLGSLHTFAGPVRVHARCYSVMLQHTKQWLRLCQPLMHIAGDQVIGLCISLRHLCQIDLSRVQGDS